MKKVLMVVLLITAFLTACGKTSSSNEPIASQMDGMPSTNDPNGSQMAGMPGMSMEPAANKKKADQVKATFKHSPDKSQPNQDTTVSVHIQETDSGKMIDQFDVKHEKQMHIIVVSKDLSFFNHIHPENKGNGEFAVTTQFPTGGEFEIIADFTPTGYEAMTKKQWITVEGNAPAAQPIEPDAVLTKVVDGKEVTLSFDHLMANMKLQLNFNIKDAKSGNAITDLQPYLGAVGHVVILNPTAEEYLHVHPVDAKATGPDAKFMATFPHSGVFKVWGQFQENGKLFVVPFVVKVP